jgi:uncharacterized protein
MMENFNKSFIRRAFATTSLFPFILIASITLTLSSFLQIRALALSKSEIIFLDPSGKSTPTLLMDIASTPSERERGLMYVKNLPEHSGMLFVFPRERIQSFWMKNCPLSLDMIFVNADREVVGIVTSAEPFSTEPLSVGKPSIYVVELVAGSAKRYGIKVGDKLNFKSEIPKAVDDFSGNKIINKYK